MSDRASRVLVIGANGSTGTRVVRLLADRPGHSPVAMIRDEAQSATFEEMDVEVAVADLEGLLDPALDGCDAVIFCAGSGAGTGLDKTVTVDRDGSSWPRPCRAADRFRATTWPGSWWRAWRWRARGERPSPSSAGRLPSTRRWPSSE